MSGKLKPVEEVAEAVLRGACPRLSFGDNLRLSPFHPVSLLILADRKEACAPLVEALKVFGHSVDPRRCAAIGVECDNCAGCAALAQAREDGLA